LQRHLDALHDAGMTSVLGEVIDGRYRVRARSGTARLDTTTPVDFDSKFRMASVTKSFIAVVILQLVGEGTLSLDDTVEQWLPGVVSGHGHDGARITIRNLLQHTSGIFNYTMDMFLVFTPEDYAAERFNHLEPAQLVAMAMQHAPELEPDTGWSYSNTNYILAGMIIEQATGRDWRAEVRGRILAPLQMSNTFDPRDTPDLPAPHAHGYDQFAPGGPLIDVTMQNHTFAGAAGSLITTTADLSRFWRSLQQGTLLGPDQMAAMHTTVLATSLQSVAPGARYGLGIMWFPTTCGTGYWGHWGDTLGFSTRLAVDDEGTRAVVVSQATNLYAESGLPIIAQDLEILGDVMCADRL